MASINYSKRPSGNSKKKKSSQFETTFVPRVKAFVQACGNTPTVDEIVDYLQECFTDYPCKKRSVLRQHVMKALRIQKENNPINAEEEASRYLEKKNKFFTEGREDHVDDAGLFGCGSSKRSEDGRNINMANDCVKNIHTNVSSSNLTYGVLTCQQKNEPFEQKPDAGAFDFENEVHTVVSEVKTNRRSAVFSHKGTSNATIIKKNLDPFSRENKGPQASTLIEKEKGQRKKNGQVKEPKKRFEPVISMKSFKDIGGYESCIQDVSKLLFHLKHPEVFTMIGIKPPRGFLLHGPPGCGKSLLANAIGGELAIPMFNVSAPEIVSGISGESEQRVRLLFAEALAVAPSIIFIDEIDSITPKRDEADKDMEKRIVTQILSCMDGLAESDTHVLVIGATNRPDSLDPALRRAGRFDREIAMGIPDRSARKSILQVMCKYMRLAPDFDFETIAMKTPGYVGADMEALKREAAIIAVDHVINSIGDAGVDFAEIKPAEETTYFKEINSAQLLREQPPLSRDQLALLYISTQHFEAALSHVQPSAKREGFATVSDVTWGDIGGLEEIREELSMAILAPVLNPKVFESLGLSSNSGILLFGPSGCGKTLLAKAVANEAGINFISVKGPELLNMYVGESEKAVRQVFQRARSSSPCVIFFDEIDALCPKRTLSGESSVTSRVVNQLLTEMDGLEDRKNVFIMGATNRPDILDSAILRPGRLDKQLYVGLPNYEDRCKILQTITKSGTKPPLSADVNIKRLAEDTRCEGFSGADLCALVREASIAALKEFMKKCRRNLEVKNEITDIGNFSAGLITGSFEPVKESKSETNGTKVDIPNLSKDTHETFNEEMKVNQYNPLNIPDLALEEFLNPLNEKSESAEVERDLSLNTNLLADLSIAEGIQLSTSIEDCSDPHNILVGLIHFEVAFEIVKPSVSEKDKIWYQQIKLRTKGI